VLNDREFKALDNLSMSLFEFEELGKIGGGAGKVTIQGLIDKGYMLKGQSTRHPTLNVTGYAITEAGRTALKAEHERRAPRRKR
jgi:hypothetical protein